MNKMRNVEITVQHTGWTKYLIETDLPLEEITEEIVERDHSDCDIDGENYNYYITDTREV